MIANKTVADFPELAAQWHPIKNGSLKPINVSYGSKKKVWWKCVVADDHEWQACANSRTASKTRKSGCPYCSNQRTTLSNCLAVTHPEIAKQWHPTKNGKLTPYDVNFGYSRNVWWKCVVADDHEWEAKPRHVGCPCCHGLKVVLSNCLAATHPEIAKQWHPTKNGNLTPYDVVSGSNIKIWWKCSLVDDHEWQATIGHRKKGDGCACCRGLQIVLSNCLAVTNPEIAKQWHPTKNGNLTPFDVVNASGKKIWWKCSLVDDHEWQAAVSTRTRGHGCACCSGRKAVISNCLATTHPEIAKQWHPTKNGNLTPFDVTFGSSSKKIWWKCPLVDDHEWVATICDQIRSTGCPCCMGRVVVLSNCLAVTNPEIAKQWHPTKNGKLTPYDVVGGCETKVWWKCCVDKEHEWQAMPSNRTRNGTSCPFCVESRGEMKIRDYVLKEHISFRSQFKFKGSSIATCRFDFAFSNGLIEYQGEQHYRPTAFGSKKQHAALKNLINNIKGDCKKLKWCHQHKIPLLLIPYWDFDRITEILDDFFADRTPTFSDPPKIVLKNAPRRQKIRERLKITDPEVLCGLIN